VHDERKHCQKIAADYSKKQWVERFRKLCFGDTKIATSSGNSARLLAKKMSNVVGMPEKNPKKILLVTDFITKLGGIETYVHDVAQLLTQQ
jgi:hypothetical protein